MDGWLSKDLETLENLQQNFCCDTTCQACYFYDSEKCLAEALFNIRQSYNYLDQVFTRCVNQIKEHF